MGDNIVKAATPAEMAGAVVNSAKPRYLSGKPRTRTIQLLEPFELHGTVYTELTAKRLTGRDLFAVNRNTEIGADQQASMFAVMCSVSTDVIEALDAEDITRLGSVLKDFMPQSTATAEQTGNDGEATPQT